MLDDQVLLMHYARSRDAVAFAELVQRYSTLVFSVARRVTGNITTAEDVTQDCFLKLARQAASIRGSLPAWLHRVAYNRSLQVTRDEATRKRHEDRISPPSDPDYEPGWNEIASLVDAALDKLPDDLCEPLLQHFLLSRTQTQIAKDLHIDQATVSRRIQEGIERIRTCLKNAGVICGTVALSSVLVKNASAAVPARLAASLAKMAIAGPTKVAAAASATAFLVTNIKLISAIAAVVIVGAILTYQITTLIYPKPDFTPKAYLSKLVLQGNGITQDSFSLAFQAAAKVLGRDADHETVYALSTNAFCPAIEYTNQGPKYNWHIQAWLGDKAIETLCARYGLVAGSLDRMDFTGNAATYRRAIVPDILKALDAKNVVLVDGGWENLAPLAGIITDVQPDGFIYGVTLNDLHNYPLNRPRGIWSLAPTNPTVTPHEADIATLRAVVARIRGQTPFEATAEYAYGLKAMDFWIKAMSETPGFCTHCMQNTKLKWNVWGRNCAHLNVQTTQAASTVAAHYLRRIAADFPPTFQSHLESAAAHYDRIVALLTPAIAETGPDSYGNILGDLSKQKVHVAKVLVPIKSEYSAIAQDLELALENMKP